MQTAGLPSPEYKQSKFMLYATLKNKTWGLENSTWESLTTGDQVSDQVGDQVSDQAGDQASDQAERMRKVLEFCKIPRSKAEISEYIGIKSQRFVRQNIIMKLLESGDLVQTIPDKPSSPKQKYVSKS